MRFTEMDNTTAIMVTIIGMVNALSDTGFILDVSQLSDSIEIEEMHNTLFYDFNIKSAKLLDNIFLYYPSTLSEEAEKALIVDAKIQYYVDNCQ